MTLLSWTGALAVVVAAFLFGQTAREARLPSASPLGVVRRHRLGLALSVSGPVLALAVGLLIAMLSGAWLPLAAGTAGAALLIAAAGLVLLP